MKKHGRCVDISKDHLKHSGRNFNSGHSTVLCTCIHVILNKDVHQKRKKRKLTLLDSGHCILNMETNECDGREPLW